MREQKNKLVDRFQRLHSGTRSGYGGVGMLTKALRLGLFKDYEAMNTVYKSYFISGKLPARTCIGVTGLAVGASIEIDLIAKT